jgi:hypothetical protein
MRNKITQIYKYLLEKKYISGIYDVTGSFSDEPQFPYYITLIHPEIDFYNRKGWDYSPTGNTWDSSELALLKCLMEMLERTSQFYFDISSIQFNKEKQLTGPHVSLATFFKEIPSKRNFLDEATKDIFGWEELSNVSNNSLGLIPAQLIYPNYSQYIYYEKNIGEPTLVPSRSTFQGSASGFDHTSTLLRAIYEVVERESRTLFITLKHKAKMLDIAQIQNENLTKLLKIIQIYQFEVYIFNIMNDLNVPVIFTLLVDKTGVGPVINSGFKAGLKLEETVIGSIEDTFYQRYFHRIEMLRNPGLFEKINELKIFDTNFKEAFILKEINRHLSFQFKDSLVSKIQPISSDFMPKNINDQQELNELIKRIKSAGFDIWYKSFDTIKNVFTYKAIIPGLQPSLRDKPLSDFYQNRLREAKKIYKKSTYYV